MTIVQTTTRQGVAFTGPSMADLMRFGVCFAPETGDGGGGGTEELPRDDDASDDLDESAAEDAFLTNIRGAEESATEESDGGEETDAETGASETSEEGDAERADEPADTKTDDAKKPAAGDDAIVEVKVGEEVHKVTIGSLKRLHGQEAALTRRSQEVAAARTEVLAQAEHAKTVLAKALERAEARYRPYAETDFFKAFRELDAETFAQLQKDAKEAHDELAFLKAEAENVGKTVDANQRAVNAERAQACVKELTTESSPHFIKGWDGKLYGELLEYAKAQGFTAAPSIVDPAAIKLLHKAYLFDRGAKLAAEKVKKVAEQPKQTLRPGSSGSSPSRRQSDDAVVRLRRSGSAEDAEAAFMSRLRTSRDD